MSRTLSGAPTCVPIAACQSQLEPSIERRDAAAFRPGAPECAIIERFGLPRAMPTTAKHADHILALATERRDLMSAEAQANWTDDEQGILPTPGRIMTVSPTLARAQLRDRFRYVGDGA